MIVVIDHVLDANQGQIVFSRKFEFHRLGGRSQIKEEMLSLIDPPVPERTASDSGFPPKYRLKTK